MRRHIAVEREVTDRKSVGILDGPDTGRRLLLHRQSQSALVSALARMGFEMTTRFEMICGKRRVPRLGPLLFARFWLGMTILVGSMMRGAHGET